MFARFDIDMNRVDLGFVKVMRPPSVGVKQWMDFWERARDVENEAGDDSIEELKETIADLFADVESLKGVLQEKEDELDLLEDALAEKDAEIVRLQREVAALMAEPPKC